MAVEGIRRDQIPSPEDRTPSPRFKFSRQLSDTELSPVDTPRKNKRKLNEPKRRTTDFSIKRLCPDSPGSACSESGRSEESTPEHVRNGTPESPAAEDIYPVTGDRDGIHPQYRHPFMMPDFRHHPYFIPQFYYNRLPVLPPGDGLRPEMQGINRAPKMNPLKVPSVPHGNGLKVPTIPPHYEHGLNVATTSSGSGGLKLPTVPHSGNGLKVPNLNVLHSQSHHMSQNNSHTNLIGEPRISTSESQPTSPRSARDYDNESPDYSKDKRNRKNYKNMTRERRVEANARERSRVHTISAAFDGLRRAVPSYSYNQKLSKLAILRIACTYINALTKLTEMDEDAPSLKLQDTSFAECVDNCTRTIQTEGKARRRH